MGTGRTKKEPWMANERTMAYHTRLLGEMARGDYLDNRTYSLDFEEQRPTSGYQVTFIRGGDSYTPTQYAEIVNSFLEYVPNHKASITKFNGYPEITFRVEGIRNALRLARKYDQHAVWDWMNEEEIEVESRRH